jgi:hypothetical protein
MPSVLTLSSVQTIYVHLGLLYLSIQYTVSGPMVLCLNISIFQGPVDKAVVYILQAELGACTIRARSVYSITSCIRHFVSPILRPFTNPFRSECINFGKATFNLSASIFSIIL